MSYPVANNVIRILIESGRNCLNCESSKVSESSNLLECNNQESFMCNELVGDEIVCKKFQARDEG